MAKRPPATDEASPLADFPDAPAFIGEREVAKAYFEAHEFCPQAVGEDKPKALADNDSPAYFNMTGITQTVACRRRPSQPIYLLPGDFVLGREFARYTKLYGGPLVELTPEQANAKITAGELSAKSKRDAAYFEARATMDGPIADRAGKVKLDNPANLAANSS